MRTVTIPRAARTEHRGWWAVNWRVKGCLVEGDGDFFEVIFGFKAHRLSLFRLDRDRDVSDPFVQACDPAH